MRAQAASRIYWHARFWRYRGDRGDGEALEWKASRSLASRAQKNAITWAAYHGVSLTGATIYTTFSSCLQFIKLVINAGLIEVVFSLLREAGVEVRHN